MSALAFGAVAWADPPAAVPAGDLDKVQGYWKPLQCDYEGKAQMPTEVMKQVTVVFDKSEYHLYFKDTKLDKDGKPIIFRLALAGVSFDSSTSPKSITFEFAEGPLKGKKSHGIYELAGNQLKMCYGSTDKPKPTKFEAPANSGLFLETWARQVK
ncbi:TIGR03067 domain-containing protein [Gemmata sp. G18]|uniref:TIGR03067 domain-containing protein n=1 Tax=Gemmata palustris TaxID=2822762 RepID=A0ABS5BLY3_9BACT|nr:TIGR03067 domain-containing protein [Gemmata palustris]MBP3954723.1 TIGR03067 domain-containing protein [Gemmata palustris]